MNSKKISITFEKKKLTLDENIKKFEQLKNFIRSNFDSLPEKIRIYYIDSEQDEITISCDADLGQLENEGDVEIKIRPYSDSDNTESEEEDDFLDLESSGNESDSGDQDKKQQQLNQLQNQEANKIQEKENGLELKINNIANKQDQSSSPIRRDHDQSIQCGNFVGSEMKDQQNQVGVSVKDQEQQIFVNQCDQSQQARIKQCDASDQTYSVESKDYSTQIQIDSKDNQSQAQVELRDNSLQTQQIEYKDNQIQTKVESSDHQIQADMIQQQDFSSQAYSNNQQGLGSQLHIPNYSVMGTNTEEMSGVKQTERQSQSIHNISQYYEEKIRVLQEGQELMMKKMVENERRFEEKLQTLQKGFNNEYLINDSTEERMKQLVDQRVNELLSEYSRANGDNFRRQDKLSRFDRIFQEISPLFNKLATITDANKLCSDYDELTTNLMQKLEIARDMYKQEILQSQSQIRVNSNSNINIQASSKIVKDINKMEQEEKYEEEEEERKQNSKQNSQIKSHIGNQSKPADPPLIMRKNESSKYEDDCIYEERLKSYQEKLRRESINEEEKIKNILKQKEQEAHKLNQEVIENMHKDYPEDVVEKAKQIAALTQEKPNKYLKYVLDYKNSSINDLIDMLFNPNIMDKYEQE